LRQYPDAVAIHHHGIAVHVHIPVKAAVHGVESGQMGIGIRIAQIVDRDDLDRVLVLTFVQSAQDISPDAPITIDAHFYCHRLPL